jgi:beta-1,4-mannosyltransferase
MLHAAVADQTVAVAPRLRIASVPSSHVYVRHLSVAGGGASAVERLADPPTGQGVSDQSPWWPPAMLEPAWVQENADDFDVFHVHFGFDARTPDQLVELVTALRTAGKPLVYTVHDLRNPHHKDRRLHDEQLDVLVPAADAIITLTRGAAAEVARRWHREAVVVPHPHVVDLPIAARVRRERAERQGPFRIGLHCKSLRAGMDAKTVIPGLVRAVRELPDAVLQVNAHRELVEPNGQRYDPQLASLLADLGPDVDVRVHDYFSDDELWEYLGSLDVSVLPYRHGTHSGWLEACRDFATDVVAPTCGYYSDQAPVHSYALNESAYDEQSLIDAVRSAHDHPSPTVDLAARRRQREAIAAAHLEVYSRLVDS